MAQRNCFNESHFHIKQIIFVALDAPTQFSPPLCKESLELDIINYQVFTYQSILLKDVIFRSFSHRLALKIFLGKKGKKVISSEIIQIKIFIQKILPFTFLPCIIETNQGLERLCRFLFASSRVHTIESKLLTSCFLFRSFHWFLSLTHSLLLSPPPTEHFRQPFLKCFHIFFASIEMRCLDKKKNGIFGIRSVIFFRMSLA